MVSKKQTELYFVFMNFDPEYEHLRAAQSEKTRTTKGASEVDVYVSRKHDELLARSLEPGSYNKAFSLVIVDAFAVEITDEQASLLRFAEEVRLVEKNQELP